MLRGIIYVIAVVALIINALTPKAAVADSLLCAQNVPAHVKIAAHVRSQINCPQTWHQLRATARAFSCPPLPDDIGDNCIQPEFSSLEVDLSTIRSDFAYKAAFYDPADILLCHHRLNI